MAPTLKRKALLPVLEAIAEALMPSQPDKASAASHEGKQDMANLYATSGKQQNNHMHQARQPCCFVMFIWQCSTLQACCRRFWLGWRRTSQWNPSQRCSCMLHADILSHIIIIWLHLTSMTPACCHPCHTMHLVLATMAPTCLTLCCSLACIRAANNI